MLAYVTIGTRDLARAAAFYDALLPIIGGKRSMEGDKFVGWDNGREGGAGLGVTYPFNDEAATVGNGVMVALQADTREQVDALHGKALELGGSDEGAPGERFNGFYAAYFRDLDGNKLNVCCFGP